MLKYWHTFRVCAEGGGMQIQFFKLIIKEISDILRYINITIEIKWLFLPLENTPEKPIEN